MDCCLLLNLDPVPKPRYVAMPTSMFCARAIGKEKSTTWTVGDPHNVRRGSPTNNGRTAVTTD